MCPRPPRLVSSPRRRIHYDLERHSAIVPDGVAGSKADPLRDRAVLLLRFGELLLRAERLLALQLNVSIQDRLLVGLAKAHTGILTVLSDVEGSLKNREVRAHAVCGMGRRGRLWVAWRPDF